MGLNSTEVSYGFGQMGSGHLKTATDFYAPTGKIIVAIQMLEDIKFHATNGTTLSFVEVRRFGKWKFKEDWSKDRGPDPTAEPDNFKYNILKNLDKKAFEQPIHLILMNQKYFNGIGNYLRAEILYRLPDVDPFSQAREVIEKYPMILELCRDIPRQAYL